MPDRKYKVMVVGLGLQGRAVLHDLLRQPAVEQVHGVDLASGPAARWAERNALPGHRTLSDLDCSDKARLVAAIRDAQVDLVACMVSPALSHGVAEACIEVGIPFVSSSYTGTLARLDGAARAAGVTVLPEMGFDPGIDLIMAREAVAEFDSVLGLYSYGAGFPEPAACDNPLNYKVTWTFDGVLASYCRDFRMIVDGQERRGSGARLYHAAQLHELEVPGFGTMEAYPNGDAVHYASIFDIQASVRDMGRFALRWPGHNATWRLLADLGLLDDAPPQGGRAGEGAGPSPRQFLARHLEPRLQFRDDERDVAMIVVDAWGRRNGREERVVYRVVDRRDLETGLFAMNRAVGYSVAIGVQLVLDGTVRGGGVLSPVAHVPGARFFQELARRGIAVERETAEVAEHPARRVAAATAAAAE
ncbi:Saccharopine dehydrogenase, NADP-dependent [Tistlia consotensis]|uniref:Saccharopine dehydrogenase, NADP-dependent n=1 Tax=Tistlia consotensis USBA 355 TaxID=560819 RepID=A0A1Y6BD99_9PROT|nr:saccharopine dehydrogenase C-terminal domain-containing protein [Tistlia consotensis]SME97992.1 Saccharopine dehydrogenase, NADP-dependent [Tistlia consotensis USBA 355]SNR57391.1 Saccharopine dehydrogenase, NADP-dependent [Tistlia consotensis]